MLFLPNFFSFPIPSPSPGCLRLHSTFLWQRLLTLQQFKALLHQPHLQDNAAMARQAANMGSSPPSSTEATHFDTPSTNITAMSPDACNSVSRAGAVPRLNLRVNTQPARAPYAVRIPATGSGQLSPTAQEFTPRTVVFSIPQAQGAAGHNVSPVRSLVASSLPDMHTNTHASAHGAIGQNISLTVVRDLNARIQLSPNVHVVFGTFSTDEFVTRTFQILDKNVPSLHFIINQFPLQFDSLACIDTKHIGDGIIRLTFHDDRDAKQAYVLVASLTHPHCELSQLTAKEVAAAHDKDSGTISNYEGQVFVSILYNAQSIMPTIEQVKEKLFIFGPVKAIETVNPMIMNAIALRVEYHDIRHAIEAVKYLGQASYDNIHFLIAHHEPDVVRRASNISPFAIRRGASAGSSVAQPSLTGRTTVPSVELARHENVMARVMREFPGPSRGSARSGHNVVDIGRIEAGIDVRTTIMLRNIPNRVDQATLKALLDETSFGDFDFMYLRIDFANNCNVGYAFINFVDPLAIIPFARARAGQRWNIFSSDKVAEISYATIQGRDCLVQKFRNSSVMLEHPSYCPKLYHTHPSASAGQEERFPEPDNFSKMKRSIDNAEHIGLYRPGQRQATAPANVRRTRQRNTRNRSTRTGIASPLSWSSSTTRSSTNTGLFAPREGQAHREEQRRRRSQFDRGTPGAEIELSSYRLTDAALEGTRSATARLNASINNLTL